MKRNKSTNQQKTKKEKHNNRIGAAYQAVHRFIERRIKTAKDKTTVILYDDKAIAIENLDMNEYMVKNCLLDKQRPGSGGTNFENVSIFLLLCFFCWHATQYNI